MGKREESTVLSPWKKIGPAEGILKRLPQRGKPSIRPIDESRPARPPGKRISKSGNVYWETRPNRSDVDRRKML
jgi:hypothetical protein